MLNLKNKTLSDRISPNYYFLCIVFVFLAFTFILYASYPGYMNPDSVNQLTQIYTGNYSDWHSPFSTIVWSVIHEIIPGPFGFIILINVLIWGSLTILFFKLFPRIRHLAWFLLLIPFFPGALNFLGNVHKDVMLVAWLLAASVTGYLAYNKNSEINGQIIYQVLANIFLLSAFLTRPNSIFAIIPVLIYTNARLGFKRNVLISFILILSMPFAHSTISKLKDSHASHPGDCIKTYHLLGLSYLEGKNLFPGKWSEMQSKKIVEACYTPVQWDSAALWGKCGFIHKELLRQNLWGSPTLTKKWLKEILKHPVYLFTIMSLTYEKSIFDPNSRSMFYKPSESDLFHWEVKTDPPRAATILVQQYVGSIINDGLGRPWFFALISIVGLAVIFKLDLLRTNLGLFSYTLLSSSLLYLLSYFAVTVSAEYRYFYWSGYSSYLGMLLAIVAMSKDRKTTIKDSFFKYSKYGAIVLVGITLGVILSSGNLPPIYKTLSITPLEDKPITVEYIRKVSIPNWMGVRIDGAVKPHNWTADSAGNLNGTVKSGALTTTIATFGQALEVGYKTGPNYGKALIHLDDQEMVVDLSQPTERSHVWLVWPKPENYITRNYTFLRRPLEALALASLTILLLLWYTRKIYIFSR